MPSKQFERPKNGERRGGRRCKPWVQSYCLSGVFAIDVMRSA